MSEIIFYFIIWWVVGFLPFLVIAISDYYKNIEIKIYDIWRCFGYSFLGPLMFIVFTSYAIQQQGWTIKRKRK